MITSYGVVGVAFVPTKLAYDFGGGLLIVPRLFDYPGYEVDVVWIQSTS